MTIGGHMEEHEIEEYSMQMMSYAESAPIEEHLLICESCRRRVQENDVYLSAMSHAGALIRSASQKPLSWFRPFPAAAAAAAILGAGFLLRTPPNTRLQEVHLYAMRGAAPGIKANANQPLLLAPDVTGLPDYSSYRIQVVNAAGKPVYTGKVEDHSQSFRMNGVPAGLYFVRLSSPSGELLREFGLVCEP